MDLPVKLALEPPNIIIGPGPQACTHDNLLAFRQAVLKDKLSLSRT